MTAPATHAPAAARPEAAEAAREARFQQAGGPGADLGVPGAASLAVGVDQARLDPRLIASLQRSAGNNAVSRLITQRQERQHRPVVQRDLSDAQKKAWEDQNGPAHVAALKAVATTWSEWRSHPDSWDSIPDPGKAPSDLAELLRTSADPELSKYAAEQLGSQAVKYLSEMTGFANKTRLLVGMVPGIAYVPPDHKYVLKQKGTEESTLNSIPFVPIAEYTVEYTNAYGWNWKKQLTGGQMQWKVGVSIERPMGGKVGAKGAGLLPMPARIDVNSKATAESVGYWGYKDLAGFVKVANGPSVSFPVIAGSGFKAVSGGIISFEGSGPPGALDFMNLQSDISVDVDLASSPIEDYPGSPKDIPKQGKEFITPKIGVTLNLLDAGGGVMVGGAQEVAIPELAPQAVPAEKIWRYIISGFETGSPDLPIPEGEIHPIIEMIKADVKEKQKSVESIKPYLIEAGVDEEFKLNFFSEGFASRKWAGAVDDADRQAKNMALSTERAQNVTSTLRNSFGDEHTYDFAGRGAAVWLPSPGSMGAPSPNPSASERMGEVVPEQSKEEIDSKVRRREEELRQSAGEFTEEQIQRMLEEFRKGLEQQNLPSSDVAFARRVNITVVWRGHSISWGAIASPMPVPVE
jgi:hypothetical protein